MESSKQKLVRATTNPNTLQVPYKGLGKGKSREHLNEDSDKLTDSSYVSGISGSPIRKDFIKNRLTPKESASFVYGYGKGKLN